MLESRHARLGSKLMNILQLRGQSTDASVMLLTREMAGLAVSSYARELRDEPIELLARTDTLLREAKRASWWLFGFAAVLALAFDITKTEVPRFLDPFGDHPPYSFTRLEIADPGADGAQVVFGESLVITAKSSGHRPGELWLSWFPDGHPEQVETVPMFDKGERGFTQQIEGVRSNLVLFVHTKNRHALSKQRRVGVILTPKLERAFVKITQPTYTGLPPDEHALTFKNVKALEGSTIEFRRQSNRPLASGHLTVTAESGTVLPVEMKPSGEKEVSTTIEAKQHAQLGFSIIDLDGFASQETWQCALLANFKKASDEQLARLGATEQETEDEVLKPLEDLSLLHEIVKDINRFKDLYAAQKEIGDELDAVEQKLWEDGKAAQEKFPKAGQSAKDIAQAMGDLRLQTLANQTTREMLAGNGDTGADLAETLRGEMEKLFSKCNGKEGEMRAIRIDGGTGMPESVEEWYERVRERQRKLAIIKQGNEEVVRSVEMEDTG